jgi:glycolate oxidase iron-sulfur subunit
VAYGELLSPFRAYAEPRRTRALGDRLARRFVRETLPSPARLRILTRLGRVAQPLARVLPRTPRTMLALLPPRLPDRLPPLPEVYPAVGKRRARVALLSGCAQQVLAPNINWATLRVLAENGVEVVIPKGQTCCGALALHTGAAEQARQLASTNLAVFPADVDAVITNAAGCGSGLHEYPLLFRGQPQEANATAFAARVQDISVFLDTLGLRTPLPLPQPVRLAYHDACHLLHAQGIRDAPRRLLASVAGVTVVEINEGDLCCGSAGTYNIDQPAIAEALGVRKVQNILQAEADAVVTGNIGCLTQIRAHLAAQGRPLPVYHTVEILDQAYQLAARVGD